MKLKIKDQIPDTEIFHLVDGEPQKSKLREIIGDRKNVLFGLFWPVAIPGWGTYAKRKLIQTQPPPLRLNEQCPVSKLHGPPCIKDELKFGACL